VQYFAHNVPNEPPHKEPVNWLLIIGISLIAAALLLLVINFLSRKSDRSKKQTEGEEE
jgi:hypothetical protein